GECESSRRRSTRRMGREAEARLRQQALETALTLARLHDGPTFRGHARSYGCMWIEPDDGPLAVVGGSAWGERSGDGARRWSFLDWAMGTGGQPPCPSVRSPRRGFSLLMGAGSAENSL